MTIIGAAGASARPMLVALVVLCARPVLAQVDLTGNWGSVQHEDWQERSPGPEAFDNLGIPLNADGKAMSMAYSTTQLSLPERQCLYYQPHYLMIGPQGIRMWSEVDPATGKVLAWNIGGAIDRSPIKIWMDGRPHPPADAMHTFAGFTTGTWRGGTLVSRTTHMKAGYLRRNGIPSSDETVFTMYMTRHDNRLTVLGVIQDPIYLTEPRLVSRTWQLNNAAVTSAGPPQPPCVPDVEVPSLSGTVTVPHYLPGSNPSVNELTRLYNIPAEAVQGGADTMYPEYRHKLQDVYRAPDRCVRYCCGWTGISGATGPAPNLQCITGGSGRVGRDF